MLTMCISSKFIGIISQNNFSSNLIMPIMDMFSKSLGIIRRAIIVHRKINGLAGRKTMNNLKRTLTYRPVNKIIVHKLSMCKIKSQFLGFF